MNTPNNLWQLLQPAFAKYRDNPAWICRTRADNRIITYQQLHAAALTIADQLRKHDIRASDSVGIIAPNGPEFAAATLASWKIGANVAPLHIGNSPHEIEQQLNALSPSILLRHETDSTYQPAMSINMSADSESIARETDLPAESEGDALAVRMYTSGSMGNPKVVRLSHRNLISNVLAACKIENFVAQDRFISLLPLSHAMGLMSNLLLPLYHGCAIVSPKALTATEILDTLYQEKISVVIAVPKLFRNVMLGLEKKFKQGGSLLAFYLAALKISPIALRQRINAPIRKKLGGNIKAWVSGGSHLDARIIRYYHRLGLPLRQGYGLTETSPLTSIQKNFDRALDSVGEPIEHVRVKVHSPDQHGCGEIWINGPNIMLGYEAQSQTDEVLQNGWFNSGDRGRLDAQGRIFLTGRTKRLIVTDSGKNVYPEELEIWLERDPNVKEAAVLEVNEKPVCILAMQSEQADARNTLSQFNQLVSVHNRITRFALVDELPRTSLGKIALQQLPTIFANHEIKSHQG